MNQGRSEDYLSYYGDLSPQTESLGDMIPPVDHAKQVAFENKLRRLGLLDHEILIFFERFVHNKTFKEITQDNGFTSIQITYRLYARAKEKLEKLAERTIKEMQSDS